MKKRNFKKITIPIISITLYSFLYPSIHSKATQNRTPKINLMKNPLPKVPKTQRELATQYYKDKYSNTTPKPNYKIIKNHDTSTSGKPIRPSNKYRYRTNPFDKYLPTNSPTVDASTTQKPTVPKKNLVNKKTFALEKPIPLKTNPKPPDKTKHVSFKDLKTLARTNSYESDDALPSTSTTFPIYSHKNNSTDIPTVSKKAKMKKKHIETKLNSTEDFKQPKEKKSNWFSKINLSNFTRKTPTNTSTKSNDSSIVSSNSNAQPEPKIIIPPPLKPHFTLDNMAFINSTGDEFITKSGLRILSNHNCILDITDLSKILINEHGKTITSFIDKSNGKQPESFFANVRNKQSFSNKPVEYENKLTLGENLLYSQNITNPSENKKITKKSKKYDNYYYLYNDTYNYEKNGNTHFILSNNLNKEMAIKAKVGSALHMHLARQLANSKSSKDGNNHSTFIPNNVPVTTKSSDLKKFNAIKKDIIKSASTNIKSLNKEWENPNSNTTTNRFSHKFNSDYSNKHLSYDTHFKTFSFTTNDVNLLNQNIDIFNKNQLLQTKFKTSFEKLFDELDIDYDVRKQAIKKIYALDIDTLTPDLIKDTTLHLRYEEGLKMVNDASLYLQHNNNKSIDKNDYIFKRQEYIYSKNGYVSSRELNEKFPKPLESSPEFNPPKNKRKNKKN